MLAFSDVMDLLADKLTRLRRWRLALTGILPGSFDGFAFRHN
jgi:hypothetical protein